MYKFILLFLCLNSYSICFLHAQENSKVDSIYNNAVSLYQQKEIDKAILEFEKVVIINPRHKDGKLDAKLLGQNKNQIVQAEITSILNQISIVPGKYMGKEVVAYGIILPVQL